MKKSAAADAAKPARAVKPEWQLRLYVAGQTAKSAAALAQPAALVRDRTSPAATRSR